MYYTGLSTNFCRQTSGEARIDAQALRAGRLLQSAGPGKVKKLLHTIPTGKARDVKSNQGLMY